MFPDAVDSGIALGNKIVELKEVTRRIATDAKLGKHDEVCAGAFCLVDALYDLPGILLEVADVIVLLGDGDLHGAKVIHTREMRFLKSSAFPASVLRTRCFQHLLLYLVMAFNERLAARIREALAHIPDVVEKKMFHGICFMVNGKMCLCVRLDDMLCRIGPKNYGEALEMNHCRPMIHNGRTMTGFVFVSEEGIRKKKDFDYWVNLALAFNKEAKASKKAVKKKK